MAAWAGDCAEQGIFAPARWTTPSYNRPVLVCILNSFAESIVCQGPSQHPTQELIQVLHVCIDSIQRRLALMIGNRLKEW